MKITLLDAAVLITNVVKGAQDPRVGFEDADRTLKQLRAALNLEVNLDQAVVESAVWSSLIASESGAFQHPDGASFEGFLQKITPQGMRFNKDYCQWERV